MSRHVLPKSSSRRSNLLLRLRRLRACKNAPSRLVSRSAKMRWGCAVARFLFGAVGSFVKQKIASSPIWPHHFALSCAERTSFPHTVNIFGGSNRQFPFIFFVLFPLVLPTFSPLSLPCLDFSLTIYIFPLQERKKERER